MEPQVAKTAQNSVGGGREYSRGLGRHDAQGRSVEVLQPAFDAPERVGSEMGSAFNLVNSIIGGGVLALPGAIQLAGVVMGPLLLVVVAVVGDFTLYILCSSSRRSGATTFEDVMAFALGERARIVCMCLVILLCYLAVVVYMILLRDLITPVVEGYITGHMSYWQSNGLLAGVVIPVVPMCLMTNMNSLRFLSLFSIAAVLVLVAGVVTRSVECLAAGDGGEVSYGPKSVMDALQAVSILVATFVSHYNLLPVHGELARPTRKRLQRVVHATVSITTVLYLTVSIFGYFYGTCHDGVESNILLSFGNRDLFINFGRLGLSCTILGTLPLVVGPCRDMLVRLHSRFVQGEQVMRHSNLADAEGRDGLLRLGEDPDDAEARRSLLVAPLSEDEDEDEDEDGDDEGVGYAAARGTDDDRALGDQGLDHSLGYTECSSDALSNAANGLNRLAAPLMVAGEASAAAAERQLSKTLMDPTAYAPRDTSSLAFIFTIAILVTAYLISLGVNDISLVMGLAGGSASIMIGFVLPPWAYLKVRKHKPYYYRLKVAARTILAISPILGVICTGVALYEVVQS